MPYEPHTASQLYAELTIDRSRETIKRTLAAVRDLLDIDVVFLSTGSAPSADGRVAALRAAGADAVSIPLHFSDGRQHGSLRCSPRKPGTELQPRDIDFMHVVASIVADQLEREPIEADRQRARFESTGLAALLAAVEARDSYTGGHCRSVVTLSVEVAQELGLTGRQIEEVEQVAMLHDVGKVAVPDAVLGKPGPLDEQEREIVMQHPVTGAQIVGSIPSLSHLAPAIRAGHERWDGRGYPDGLCGERIPLSSRITFACDAYDAMTSDRPYRDALGERTARAELRAHSGSQFCVHVTSALLRTLERTAA